MKPIDAEILLAAQNHRYATKEFDPGRMIPSETWGVLEECLRLSPSSFGLQPWKFFVITDPKIREALLPLSWGQRQVVEASHLVVFAVRHTLTGKDVERHMDRIAADRTVERESLQGFEKVIKGFLEKPPYPLDMREWSTRQVYIALGNFMTSAALLGIDTCPMEGLDPAGYDRVLGLTDSEFRSVVACPAGYRSLTDKNAGLPKVRFGPEEVFERRD